MLFLDLGNNTVHYMFSNGSVGQWRPDELFEETLKLPSGTQIVGESAHFGTPRSSFSKAQYYTADELIRWYEQLKVNNIQLYLAAEKETVKWRKRLSLDKGDNQDLMALEFFVKECPTALKNMKRPPKDFNIKDSIAEANSFRNEIGSVANKIRRFDYCHEDDKCSLWLHDNIVELCERLSPKTREIMCMEYDDLHWSSKNNGDNAPAGSLKSQKPLLKQMRTCSIIPVVLCHLNHDGSPRPRESTGSLAGWSWVKNEIFLQKPYRPVKAGTCRSNLQYHGLRQYTATVMNKRAKGGHPMPLSSYTKEEETYRKTVVVKDWNKAVKDLFVNIKAMVNEQFKDELSVSEYVFAQV